MHHVEQQSARKALDDNAERVAPREAHPASSDFGNANAFEATLESHNESIDDFNVILEVDNVTTIKDLVQKDFGVSILAKSVCLREVRKKKLTIVPIENLSMARETNIVYHKSFVHTEVLQDITQLYHDTKKHYLV